MPPSRSSPCSLMKRCHLWADDSGEPFAPRPKGTQMTANADALAPPSTTRAWMARIGMLLLGATAFVVLLLALGGRAASARPIAGQASSGFTLCAGKAGKVTYSTTGSCSTGKKIQLAKQSTVTTLQSKVSTLQFKVAGLQSSNAALQSAVGVLQSKVDGFESAEGDLASTLSGVTRTTVNGQPTLQISGVNLQLVNGSGSETSTNGVGNLIIGYNETPGTQTGSHNLVLGNGQKFTSYGGLLAGAFNATTSPFASVTGGWYNIAADNHSSISGGCDNATGPVSVPTGPCSTGAEAILGGASNLANAVSSTVSGGQSNVASAALAAVAGGYDNTASGVGATVGGGYGNQSKNNETSIAGGGQNTATGAIATIAGGYDNSATQDEATVLGGCSNLAGSGTLAVSATCFSYGNSYMAILGGIGNEVDTLGSVIDGGRGNHISGGNFVAISGGHAETNAATDYLTRAGSNSFTP